MTNEIDISPFYVRSCAMSAIANGERASSLLELRDRLIKASLDCIYYHFWGSHLTSALYPEFHNDFAEWAYHCLHDETLAERFGIVDPTNYSSLEEMQKDLVNIVEQRLNETSHIPAPKIYDEFHFIRSNLIVFKTPHRIEHPEELPKMISSLSPSSIFYHFIDARSRTPNREDDFTTWLKNYSNKYTLLIENIGAIDPYFVSLSELRKELIDTVNKYFGIIEEDRHD